MHIGTIVKIPNCVNPLQNRETSHVNIVLQCMYPFFEQPNMKYDRIEWYASKCYHVLNWFFLPKPEFWEFIWIFSGRNHLKINISHILNPKSYQINSIKSYSSRSFQQDQRHIPIPPKFSATILFYFQWKVHSIFKNFCTASPNVMKPSPCTPPCQELSKETKNMIWSIWVRWIL
jgi:hypothetical protein